MSKESSNHSICFQDIEEAHKRIAGTAHLTPVLTSQSINITAGRNCFFKVEALQKTGSFKFRGALNAVRAKLEELPDDCSRLDVVTHSSGNHAQALALAAKLSSTPKCGVFATIVMPRNAPVVKKNAVISFGGNVVETENTNEARENESERIRLETGAVFVHPSEDPRVIAGQGTVCLEFVDQIAADNISLDVVVIPVGGGKSSSHHLIHGFPADKCLLGGLASGNTVSLRKLLGDKVKIVLAEPSELDDAKRSLEAGKILRHSPDNKLNSVADGLKTTLGPNTFPILRDGVDDVITVSEESILRATKLVWERLKICIEPSAGVGVAVTLSHEFNVKFPSDSFPNVGVILCGGNVDVVKIAAMMSELA